MEDHTFAAWLESEVTAVCCALLNLFEKRDKMKFIDAPRIERDYMEKVGRYEETVIKEEIEAELLQKKKQLVQAAANRREPIDETAIDAEISRQREILLREAAGTEATRGYEILDERQLDEIDMLYRDIVRKFHPETHSDLTETHRSLFMKAQDAYRRHDLPAMRLIHDMLEDLSEGGIKIELTMTLMNGETNSSDTDIREDLMLIPAMFKNFEHTLKETVLCEDIENYREQAEEVMAEIEDMRNEFPFIAEEMLSDPEKTAEYKRQLDLRLEAAKSEQKRRADEIRNIIEGAVKRG